MGLARFRSRSKLLERMKYWISGLTCKRHCNMEFIKQVLPRFSKPISIRVFIVLSADKFVGNDLLAKREKVSALASFPLMIFELSGNGIVSILLELNSC